jgi:arginyl-tRNA synthetase
MDKLKKGSHAQGDNPVQKQASQLAYDVKYKVKLQLNKGTKMNPAQIAKAYVAQLAKSPAPPAVKALAKKKLIENILLILKIWHRSLW